MSLFNNAIRFINNRKKVEKDTVKDIPVLPEQSLELDFSLRNYVKESFSVLIVRPISACMQKVLRGISFAISGILVGTIIAFVFCVLCLQFSSVENSVVSSLVINKLESLFEDADVSIKSAMVNWNSDSRSMEINLRKVRINDLMIPRVTIIPNYLQSLRNQKLVAKTVSVIKPKIAIDITDDFKTVSFNPNLEKGNGNKALLEPISSLTNLKNILEKDTLLEIVNADVSVFENGTKWDFRNVYCEYNLQDEIPNVINVSIILPRQKYESNIKIKRLLNAGNQVFDVKFESLNPFPIYMAFSKRNASLEKIMNLIKGYNLPLSGSLKLNLRDNKLVDCKFDLLASSGCIRLPNRNTLSLNLGKRIDNGNISGVITADKAIINFINIYYGNSGLQLTGLEVPMSDYKFLDVANIDGTLSLTNIDVREMESILPQNISQSIIPAFKNYLPGFKLQLFKVDLKGPIFFGDGMNNEKLFIGQGLFKINDAQIPVGEHVVTNVNAVGNITKDGIDIKLANAMFNKTKINSGVFFISNIDNSWIGNVNADIDIGDISSYAKEISGKLSSLPIEKIDIKGKVNLDMKLVRINGDKLHKLPFRIVKGDGVIKSDDNTKNLKLSWDDKKLSFAGDISTGTNSIHFKLNETFADKSGAAEYHFVGNSAFQAEFLPNPVRFFKGNFDLNMNNVWRNGAEDFDIVMNLKDTVVSIPALGDMKSSNENGVFKTHISKYDDMTILSKLSLDTKNAKINGQITLDNSGNMLECILDKFDINGCSAKINALKKSDNHIILSIVGDSIDVNRIIYGLKQQDKNVKITAYLNLKTLNLFHMNQIQNVKGTLDILDRNIVGGSCIGTMGDNTTIAVTAKDINNAKDCLLSVSASDAGVFLRNLGIMDTISGGTINVVMKSSKLSGQSMSGAFEIKDFLVKNNNNLNKLISLSSTNWLPNSGDLVVGFNSCLGDVIVTNDSIKIDRCKAIGPTTAISLDGMYDRQKDEFYGTGIALPMSSVINSQSTRGALAARYKLSGSLGMLSVSVDSLRFISNDDLLGEFGALLPIMDIASSNGDYDMTSNTSIASDDTDPFSQKAFDRDISAEHEQRPLKVKNKKVKKRKKTIDKKFGVKINRGLGK